MMRTIFGHELPAVRANVPLALEAAWWLPGAIRRAQDTRRSVNGYRYSAPFEARTVAVITQNR